MIKPEFDLVTCLVCGAAPKFVCSDGNTKVSCIPHRNRKQALVGQPPILSLTGKIVLYAVGSSPGTFITLTIKLGPLVAPKIGAMLCNCIFF